MVLRATPGSSDSRSLVVALAGHDSSGRAGIDADREAAEHHGLELAAVVTAWTEQGEGGVHAIRPRPEETWRREAQNRLGRAAALKTGLLPGAAHVLALARLLDTPAANGLPVVVDPVLSASSGEPFLDQEGLRALRAEILTRPVVLTPNLPEAARLACLSEGELGADLPLRLEVAASLLELGLAGVVLTGGHAGDDPVHDLVWERGGEPLWHVHARVGGPGMRGSGCRHATALACGLARGLDLAGAAEGAGDYLARLLRAAAPH